MIGFFIWLQAKKFARNILSSLWHVLTSFVKVSPRFMCHWIHSRRALHSISSSESVNPKCGTKEYSFLIKLRLHEAGLLFDRLMPEWPNVRLRRTEKISHDWFVVWIWVTKFVLLYTFYMAVNRGVQLRRYTKTLSFLSTNVSDTSWEFRGQT